jgi:FkbM family methyltransferase
MYKSQNNEIEVVLNYFSSKPKKKTVLSIGENDGITFSNSYDLIQAGWDAHLIEPSPKAFEKLKKVHEGNDRVNLYNFGIYEKTGTFIFNESGSYDNAGDDVALLSCLIDSEKERWGNKVSFEKINAYFVTFEDFIKGIKEPVFDFITIDAEGLDYQILTQIDLAKYNCKCLCIEHNGIHSMIENIKNYCVKYNMKQISMNPENLIFAL